jgi:hypothetical protein
VPRSVPEAKLWVARLVLAAASCYGVYSFVRLGMLPDLLGEVQFAAAGLRGSVVLGFARYTACVLIACLIVYDNLSCPPPSSIMSHPGGE